MPNHAPARVRPLIVGVPGPDLGDAERAVLEEVRPAGVVLFARNLVEPGRARELVAELATLDPPVLVAVDLEGGAVNRLTGFWGDLPSPARAASVGRRAVRALGDAAGAACRSLGIHLDLAPVVDLACHGGLLALQERCLGDRAEKVASLAQIFIQGLRAWGVSGCLKHFPGLGPVPEDTHERLPVVSASAEELAAHIETFERLARTVQTVMMAHAVVPALGDHEHPASLSRAATSRAAALPGSPVVLSDDLEMGALAEWGSLADRAVAALEAHNHGVLICRAFDELPAIAARLDDEAARDPRFRRRVDQAVSRLGTWARGIFRAAATLPAPDDEAVARLWLTAREETAR